MTITYLTLEEVVVLQQSLINEFGGHHGIRDRGALESALMRPQLGYYDTLFEQAAALVESLANNHPFIDGNKRIAFFATDVFLRMNGYYLDCESEVTYAHWIRLFEDHQFYFDHLKQWIETVCKPFANGQ
jgi:death-on-curing protein